MIYNQSRVVGEAFIKKDIDSAEDDEVRTLLKTRIYRRRTILSDMNNRCLIQIMGNNGYVFISKNGGYTEIIDEATIFTSELDAYLYVEKHGLDRIARVRCIK